MPAAWSQWPGVGEGQAAVGKSASSHSCLSNTVLTQGPHTTSSPALIWLLLISLLRDPSSVPTKAALPPPKFCFCSIPFTCISSLPAPALAPGMHLP